MIKNYRKEKTIKLPVGLYSGKMHGDYFVYNVVEMEENSTEQHSICLVSQMFQKVSHSVAFFVVLIVLPMVLAEMGYHFFEQWSLLKYFQPQLILQWSCWSIIILITVFGAKRFFERKI